MFDIKKIPKHTARAACHKFGKKAYPSNPLPFIYRGIIFCGYPWSGVRR